VKKTLTALAGTLVVAGLLTTGTVFGQRGQGQGQQQPMGFFVTSVGGGDGANYGGLEGADKHCQSLAAAVGAGNRTWRAYLSAAPQDGRLPEGATLADTCNNWTSNADTGVRAMVGHHDRLGGQNVSWNAVHYSAGCSQAALVKTGGAGLLYCFAAD
jgi:hypothetical protein